MIGMQSLPALPALLRRAYPNDRTVKLAIAARAAGNRFASQRMLSHFLPVLRFSIIIVKGYGVKPHVYP